MQTNNLGRWRGHALALVILAPTATTQTLSWVKASAGASPPARRSHAMALDSARGVVVLFGGTDNRTVLGDTWEWDGRVWTQRTPIASPPARAYHAMCYDSRRQVCVLTGGVPQVAGGGASLGQPLDDTWEWDGTGWTLRCQPCDTGPRQNHSLSFDPVAGHALMFGGCSGSSFAGFCASNDTENDLWSWDGTTWNALGTTSARPPARQFHATAYDPQRNRLVLFGGLDTGFATLGDTWEWDGSSWTRRSLAPAPFAQHSHMLAYSQPSGGVILHGGDIGSGTTINRTWRFLGARWEPLATGCSPGPSNQSAMVPAPDGQQLFLFGGRGARPTHDTSWHLAHRPGSAVVRGQGCGPVGAPLRMQPGNQVPQVGTALPVTATGAQSGWTVFGTVGFSDSLWGLFPLPWAPAAVVPTYPGCLLYASIDDYIPATVQSNSASWTLPIPNAPCLVDLEVYSQAIAFDLTNGRLATSDLLELSIGR